MLNSVNQQTYRNNYVHMLHVHTCYVYAHVTSTHMYTHVNARTYVFQARVPPTSQSSYQLSISRQRRPPPPTTLTTWTTTTSSWSPSATAPPLVTHSHQVTIFLHLLLLWSHFPSLSKELFFFFFYIESFIFFFYGFIYLSSFSKESLINLLLLHMEDFPCSPFF